MFLRCIGFRLPGCPLALLAWATPLQNYATMSVQRSRVNRLGRLLATVASFFSNCSLSSSHSRRFATDSKSSDLALAVPFGWPELVSNADWFAGLRDWLRFVPEPRVVEFLEARDIWGPSPAKTPSVPSFRGFDLLDDCRPISQDKCGLTIALQFTEIGRWEKRYQPTFLIGN